MLNNWLDTSQICVWSSMLCVASKREGKWKSYGLWTLSALFELWPNFNENQPACNSFCITHNRMYGTCETWHWHEKHSPLTLSHLSTISRSFRTISLCSEVSRDFYAQLPSILGLCSVCWKLNGVFKLTSTNLNNIISLLSLHTNKAFMTKLKISPIKKKYI